jgi:hypothetical protein
MLAVLQDALFCFQRYFACETVVIGNPHQDTPKEVMEANGKRE